MTMIDKADVSFQIEGDPVPSTADELPFADRLEATDRAWLDEELREGRVEGLAVYGTELDITRFGDLTLSLPLSPLPEPNMAAVRLRAALGVTRDEMWQRAKTGAGRSDYRRSVGRLVDEAERRAQWAWYNQLDRGLVRTTLGDYVRAVVARMSIT